MTDNEIIKGLECCADEMGCIKGCPCFDPKAKGSNCTIYNIGLEKIALDLINRLKAENERLESRNKFLEVEYKNQGNLFWERVNGAKSEAYKEFASRLKEKYKKDFNSTWSSVYNPIDNLLKEMG